MTAALKAAIDAFSVTVSPNEFRWHLGASIIGHECKRHLWYHFRWAKMEQHDGRMKRLFGRGHDEEPKLINLLEGVGFQCWPNDPATGKQWRMSAVGGHYGGSTDGFAYNPTYCPETVLTEFKTHNTKSFTHLVTNKVQKSKPKHYTQMSVYGRAFSTRFGLYVAANKNDDDIYTEIVPLDWKLAEQMEQRASEVILAPNPPARISMSPAYLTCKFCTYVGPCHEGEHMLKHCRTCRNSTPVDGGEWFCQFHNGVIPRDFVPKGCEAYTAIRED